MNGGQEVGLEIDGHHRDRPSEEGVQLVDVAVRHDTLVVLRDPGASEQPGLSAVSRPRIDLHRGWKVTAEQGSA